MFPGLTWAHSYKRLAPWWARGKRLVYYYCCYYYYYYSAELEAQSCRVDFATLCESLLILQLRIPHLEAWNPRLCPLCRATGKTAGSRVCESSWQARKFCMDVSCQCWLRVSVLRSNPPPHPRSWFLASWRLDACGVLLWFLLPMGILSLSPSHRVTGCCVFYLFPLLVFWRRTSYKCAQSVSSKRFVHHS